MSLLRDGLHRRAPLTARLGVARLGAARLGCAYGQNDLATLTREIKDEHLESVGAHYVWAEVLRTSSPFGNLTQYISSDGICAFTLSHTTSTYSFIESANLLLGADSTDYFNPAMLANLFLGCGDGMEGFVQDTGPAGQLGKQGPNPFGGPMRRLSSAKGY